MALRSSIGSRRSPVDLERFAWSPGLREQARRRRAHKGRCLSINTVRRRRPTERTVPGARGVATGRRRAVPAADDFCVSMTSRRLPGRLARRPESGPSWTSEKARPASNTASRPPHPVRARPARRLLPALLEPDGALRSRSTLTGRRARSGHACGCGSRWRERVDRVGTGDALLASGGNGMQPRGRSSLVDRGFNASHSEAGRRPSCVRASARHAGRCRCLCAGVRRSPQAWSSL